MTFYGLSTMPLGNVLILLVLLMCNVGVHAWAIRCLIGYRFTVRSNRLVFLLGLFILLSLVGLVMRMAVIFTDQAPPLRVVDFMEYGAQLGIIASVSAYLNERRIRNEVPLRRRAGDRLDHA